MAAAAACVRKGTKLFGAVVMRNNKMNMGLEPLEKEEMPPLYWNTLESIFGDTTNKSSCCFAHT